MPFLLLSPLLALAMEPSKAVWTTDTQLWLLKNVVKNYLPENTDLLVHALSDSQKKYAVDRKSFTEQEINASKSLICKDKGIMCVHNEILVVDLGTEKVEKVLQINPNKIEGSDKLMPAITALAHSKLGGKTEQIILGELRGQVFVADLEARKVNRFGQVAGRINEIVCNPEGSAIALKYVSKIEEGKKEIPCLALSISYLKSLASSSKKGSRLEVPQKNNRRSWAPSKLEMDWTPFLSEPCLHEPKKIYFDGDYCVTQCSVTEKIEKWIIQNPDGDAKLVKVDEAESELP